MRDAVADMRNRLAASRRLACVTSSRHLTRGVADTCFARADDDDDTELQRFEWPVALACVDVPRECMPELCA